MQLVCLIGLALAGFLIRFLPRLRLRHAIVSDTYYHLYCAEQIRANRFRLPDTLPGVVLNHEYLYPYGYHLFLALFPDRARVWAERATGALFDTVNTCLVYFACRWFLQRAAWPQSGWLALLVAALFCFSPALLRIGSGPRAYNGSPRVPGQTLYLLHILAAYHAWTSGSSASLAISLVAGSLVILSAIFSTQVLFFFGLFFSILLSPLYLLILAGCVAGSALLSGGRSFGILRASVGHTVIYARELQQIFLYPHIVTGRDYLRSLARIPERLRQPRKLLNWFLHERYHLHLLWTVFPQVLAAPLVLRGTCLRGADARFLSVWVLAGAFWFIVTRQRRLLFLGEGERYLEAAVTPSLILFAALLWQPHPGLVLALLGYSLFCAGYFHREYRRSFQALHDDAAASGRVFAQLALLPPGPVLPVGWVHWQAMQRAPFPVLTYGGRIDPRLVPLEEFLLVFGNYPYPGKAFRRITERYGIQYVVAERSCLEHYLAKILEDPREFWDAVTLLGESATIQIFTLRPQTGAEPIPGQP